VVVAFATHPSYLEHQAGRGHPERPARLEAVLRGAALGEREGAVVRIEPRPASRAELERAHPAAFLDALERFCRAGGGRIDADTSANPASGDAAVLAAGATLSAIEALDAGGVDAAFCAVRPPGHHATATRAMGFCLVNNVAIAAAHLAARGERVVIVDYDAHHGNGTQDIFYDRDDVLYLSFHQAPFYPGSGAIADCGTGAGAGCTVNMPVPADTTGSTYFALLDEVVEPIVERFAPTWLLMSAGFDAHRDDPLTDLGLTSADFGLLTQRLARLVPAGRRLALLEGGYDLDALTHSTAAVLAVLADVSTAGDELPSSGAADRPVVDEIARFWSQRGQS
jgi:acetoin utilization deacetylase AcuC-like enzyme